MSSLDYIYPICIRFKMSYIEVKIYIYHVFVANKKIPWNGWIQANVQPTEVAEILNVNNNK